MKKRVLSLLIILSMLVGMAIMPVNTLATSIENAEDAQYATEQLNYASTVEEIVSVLDGVLQAYGLTENYFQNLDREAFAELIINEKDDMLFDTDDTAFRLKYLAALSLYNYNPYNIDLFDEEGGFVFRDELKMDAGFNEGTFMTTFDEELTFEGRMFVHEFLMSRQYSKIDEFFEAASEAIVLGAINYNVGSGYGHIDEILNTYANHIGLDVYKYNSLTENKKAAVCKMLMGGYIYSIEDLSSSICNAISQMSASGNSGGGGGGGGSYRLPFEYTVTPTNEIKVSFEDVCYEEDVDFILAAYDGEELIGLKKTELEAGKNHSFDVTLSLSSLTDNLIVKRFVWSADGNCTPVTTKGMGECVYKNTVTFPSSDFIEYITPDVIKYESAESAREIYYQLSEVCELYVNDKRLDGWDEGIINQYLSYRNTDIRLEDVSYEKEGLDNKYDRVYVDYYDDAVVDSVITKDNGATIYFKASSNHRARLQYENDCTDVRFIKHGEEISVEDLKENDVLTIMYDVEGDMEYSEFLTVYVEDKSISGALTEIDTEKNSIYVNGTEYQCEDYIWAEDYQLDEEFVLYFNCFGNIVYIEEDISGRMYGVIVGMYRSSSNDRPMVRLITDYGKIVTYECKNDWITEEFMNIIRNATGRYFDYNSTIYLDKSELTPDIICNLAVEYKLSGGKLSKANWLCSGNYDTRLEYREKSSKFGVYSVNEKTKFVCTEDYLNDGNEVYTVTLDDFEDETEYDMFMYAKNQNTGTYSFVLVMGGLSGVGAETSWGIIRKVSSCIYNEDDCYKLEVLKYDEKQNTEIETVYISTSAVWYDSPKAGDVIMYYVGRNGYVEEGYFYQITNGFEKYDHLYQEAMWCNEFSEMINPDVLHNLVENSNREVEYIFGPVYRSSDSKLELITSKEGDVSDTNISTEIFTIGADAKTYICDYSKRGTYRFYRGDVPYQNKSIFRPALTGAETEMIDWSIVEQEEINPNFALLKVVDGDVMEVVSFTDNMITVDKTETGQLTAFNTVKNTITINDVEYECDQSIITSELELANEYTVYIAPSGKVIYIEMLDKPGNYGVIVAMQDSIEYNNPLVKIITDEGKFETYECENANITNQVKQIIADAGIDISSNEYLSRNYINAENIVNLTIDYSVFENKLSEISSIYSANSNSDLIYKAENGKFDMYSVNENTKFILIEDYLNGGSDIHTVTLSDFKDNICYDIYLYDKGINTGNYMFGLVTGDMTIVTAQTDWAVVKSAGISTYEDEDCYELEVLKLDDEHNTETVYVSCEAVQQLPEKGDVVMYDISYNGYVEYGDFFTVMNGLEYYGDLYNEAMRYDWFSDIINQDMMNNLVEITDGEVDYIFAPVYRRTVAGLEVIMCQSENTSNVNYDIEAFVLRDDVKSYICNYSFKGEERFYEAPVPNVNPAIFRPVLFGHENEMLDWVMVEQEDVCPNFALLKVVDGDVMEVVTYIAE